MSKQDLPDFDDWDGWVDAEDVIRKLHITKRNYKIGIMRGLPTSCKRQYYYHKSDVLVLMNNYNGKKGDCDE